MRSLASVGFGRISVTISPTRPTAVSSPEPTLVKLSRLSSTSVDSNRLQQTLSLYTIYIYVYAVQNLRSIMKSQVSAHYIDSECEANPWLNIFSAETILLHRTCGS